MSKREFLKCLGLGAAGIAGQAIADRVPAAGGCAPTADGKWFVAEEDDWRTKRVFDLPPTRVDGPSAFMKDGKVYRPAAEVPVFHKTEIVVVGGGPAGFAAAIAAIPYRQLVPKGVEGLLCVGRMLGTKKTQETFRLICPCMVTGEAAGTAAALSVRAHVAPRNVDITRLRKRLADQNVCIG